MPKKILTFILIIIILVLCAYLFSPLRPIAQKEISKAQPVDVIPKPFKVAFELQMAPYVIHEDSAVDKDGNLFAGGYNPQNETGVLFRVSPDKKIPEEWLKLKGHVAGMHFDSQNNLWACDPINGLLKISLEDKIEEIIVDRAEGNKFGLLNDLDIASDGTIYMTDSSLRSPFQIRAELIEAKPTGRLIKRQPNGEIKVLMNNLFWANGVLLSPQEDYLLVAEMGFYRIWKHWLKGDEAGKSEIWLDKMLGFPNGLSYSKQGNVLIGIIAMRSPLLDTLHPFAGIKRIFGSIPEWLQPKQSNHGLLLEYSPTAQLLRAWIDTQGSTVIEVSSAEFWNGQYVLGSDRQTNMIVVNLE